MRIVIDQLKCTLQRFGSGVKKNAVNKNALRNITGINCNRNSCLESFKLSKEQRNSSIKMRLWTSMEEL